jgi:hypothetical protein
MSRTTPEGRVKNHIREILDSYGVYYLMPVSEGYSSAGVDFHCVVRQGDMALAFFIEAKRPGELPTDRQKLFMGDRAEHQKAISFVIDKDPSIGQGGGTKQLIAFLEKVKFINEHYDAQPIQLTQQSNVQLSP